MAQLATVPLLLTGLIALKNRQLALPRNRFVAYKDLTKLLVELHPTARDRAALAGVPRHSLDIPTLETALAALSYAIHCGEDSPSADAIETERAVAVVSQYLVQQIGMNLVDAMHAARAALAIGEEDIGILVKKSPHEVGFFHRLLQEFLSAKHILSMDFNQQADIVGLRAADPRWSEVILCLLHQLQRPAEIDCLLAKIEDGQGDVATAATRDVLLAEATFGEIKKSPQTAFRLADKAFDQIELGRWHSVRSAIAAHAIDGLSSPALKAKASARIRRWFPRWHSYSLADTFQIMADWPDDPGLRPTLWRGLHDEYFEAAQAAARCIGKRFAGQSEVGDALCKLIASPPSVATAAAAIGALCHGWQQHPRLVSIMDEASKSDSELIAIAGIRGRIALGRHKAEDFEHLTQLASRDTYTLSDLVGEAMVAGWAGDERLRTFALHRTPNEEIGAVRRIVPDFRLLINGFPGDHEVAALVASDFANEHPICLFAMRDLHSLAVHFKNHRTIVPALEEWVIQNRSNDAYTLAHAAWVAPTATLKSALVECVKGNHLSFWAASALVDLWGAQDAVVQAALLEASSGPIEQRQNIAHVLPFVMADKVRCRRLLLEVVAAKDRIRADFALQGLRNLEIDASDRNAVDCVLARGYDEERFAVENEAREVITTFHHDPRVAELAKRQLQQTSGVIATIASVFANNAEMRRLVMNVATPLDLQMRLTILESLASRHGVDDGTQGLISAARKEESGEIIIAASIKLAKNNVEADRVSTEYLAET